MQSFTEGVQSMLLAAGVLRMGHHRVGALPTARRADGKRSGGLPKARRAGTTVCFAGLVHAIIVLKQVY